MEGKEMNIPGFTAEASLYKAESKGMAKGFDQADRVIPQKCRYVCWGPKWDRECDIICLDDGGNGPFRPW